MNKKNGDCWSIDVRNSKEKRSIWKEDVSI
jgi:hypothetical protein